MQGLWRLGLNVWGVILFVAANLISCASFGVYHEVRRCETLYSISKTYGVPMKDIMAANDIVRPDRLQAGDVLFIPGADEVKDARPASCRSRSKHHNGKIARTTITTEYKKNTKQKTDNSHRVVRSKVRFDWPLRGVLTSRFGKRWGRVHNGIDISAPRGTVIRAAAAGEVIEVRYNFHGYGNILLIQHDANFITVYAHCQTIKVAVGEHVERGQPIATVGDTGNATGPHLHFEIRYKGKPVNPLRYLPSLK